MNNKYNKETLRQLFSEFKSDMQRENMGSGSLNLIELDSMSYQLRWGIAPIHEIHLTGDLKADKAAIEHMNTRMKEFRWALFDLRKKLRDEFSEDFGISFNFDAMHIHRVDEKGNDEVILKVSMTSDAVNLIAAVSEATGIEPKSAQLLRLKADLALLGLTKVQFAELVGYSSVNSLHRVLRDSLIPKWMSLAIDGLKYRKEKGLPFKY